MGRQWSSALVLMVLAGCGGGETTSLPPLPSYFPEEAPWSEDISQAPVDAESEHVIGDLVLEGSFWGGAIAIEFGMHVLAADETVPMRTFSKTSNFFVPDCDDQPVPVPVMGALEGQHGYACVDKRDCHLL